MPEKDSKISSAMKRIREEMRLSQKGLAELSGVSFRTIQDAEKGKTDLGAAKIVALADTFKVSLDELLRGHKTSAETTPAEALTVLLGPKYSLLADLIRIATPLKEDQLRGLIDMATAFENSNGTPTDGLSLGEDGERHNG